MVGKDQRMDMAATRVVGDATRTKPERGRALAMPIIVPGMRGSNKSRSAKLTRTVNGTLASRDIDLAA